jgi:hypothetical protein
VISNWNWKSVSKNPKCHGDAHRQVKERQKLSNLRKRRQEPDEATSTRVAGEVDITSCATILYSSENPAHLVDYLLDGRYGPGATRWVSARSDVTEQVLLEFDKPQTVSLLVYEVEETMCERTQEVRVEVSEDEGRTYRQALVQEYTFSPAGATYQREELRLNLRQATHLRLTIVPNKNGSGSATLASLRLFA